MPEKRRGSKRLGDGETAAGSEDASEKQTLNHGLSLAFSHADLAHNALGVARAVGNSLDDEGLRGGEVVACGNDGCRRGGRELSGEVGEDLSGEELLVRHAVSLLFLGTV